MKIQAVFCLGPEELLFIQGYSLYEKAQFLGKVEALGRKKSFLVHTAKEE